MLILLIFFRVKHCIGLHEGKTFEDVEKMSLKAFHVLNRNLLSLPKLSGSEAVRNMFSWCIHALTIVKANISPPYYSPNKDGKQVLIPCTTSLSRINIPPKQKRLLLVQLSWEIVGLPTQEG